MSLSSSRGGVLNNDQTTKLLSVKLHYEHDVVLTRQRARQIAGLLGFEVLDQTRIATAVSELARNVIAYAKQGTVEFLIGRSGTAALLVRIADVGPGIKDLRAVMDGRYTTTTGAGVGIIGAKRLMDQFHIDSDSGHGTTVLIGKFFPPNVVDNLPERISNIIEELAKRSSQNPFEEIQRQNQELLTLMEDLRTREDELLRLNQELSETNRGVVALYSELDVAAGELQQASELKSSFLSNMSHEFRTPLASIISLAGILIDRLDGDLSEEQEKQVSLIKSSADSLLGTVNDLLDLAKIEAGKTEIQPGAFDVADLFGALRGLFRPLITSDNVALVFEEPSGIPMLYTDEGKLSQILRNFISNALKFTHSGSIRVAARIAGKNVIVSVEDSGIGIATEHQDLIFVEFAQVPGEHQNLKLGTGLGLPLSRKLAHLLGGDVWVKSVVGSGSVFHVEIPLVYSR